jgi:hypothetical protein
VIGWRQSKITGETLREKVIVRLFVQANTEILDCTEPEMETSNSDNDLQMMPDEEEIQLHRIGKVQDFLEIW